MKLHYDFVVLSVTRSLISFMDRKAILSKLLKGKEKKWGAAANRNGPLHLLELPLDILRLIVKEVTHTNDLTSLALTHSALHRLAIPHIYSRFDIVWPDAQATSEPRSGVDALTYGLATLVMQEDLFGYTAPHEGKLGQNSCLGFTCNHCGMANDLSVSSLTSRGNVRKQRRGNLYSQYTRKFSLGNGPADWVQEYLINKEGGKMLGTLVALTIARMPNLETLIWDMPTGILADVWQALASLSDRPGHKSRLEKVWVRFHDNREVISSSGSVSATTPPASSQSAAATSSSSNPNPGPAGIISSIDISYQNTEHPNFSILPSLRSLSVLEIDELAYLKEMSILIGRSWETLRELRIGLSKIYASQLPRMTVGSDSNDPKSFDMSYYIHGGVLGLLMGHIYDCRKVSESSKLQGSASVDTPKQSKLVDSKEQNGENDVVDPSLVLPFAGLSVSDGMDTLLAASIRLPDSPNLEEASPLATESSPIASPVPLDIAISPAPELRPTPLSTVPIEEPQKQRYPSDLVEGLPADEVSGTLTAIANNSTGQKSLRLETFELEKIPINVAVLQKSIDWSVLTALTLLDCGDHERLWKALRRTYSPKSASTLLVPSTASQSRQSTPSHLRKVHSSIYGQTFIPEYPLKLKRIHTDTVSTALISFLKETLAPNSLEWMLLQERGQYISPVTVEAIYRGPLRYHRASLKKVLIDSSDAPTEHRTRSTKWKKWIVNRDTLTFITSGKMCCLRELGIAVDYKDWHFFLQRLPNIPHLRSFYVPHIANHVYEHPLDAKELASQVVDLVIALRPEIELCYMGILAKCFEILENRPRDACLSNQDSRTTPASSGDGGDWHSDTDSNDTDDDDDDDDDEDDEDGGNTNGPSTATTGAADAEDTESDAAVHSAGDSDDEDSGNGKVKEVPRFRLREILFYDDKISIFKARHGRL